MTGLLEDDAPLTADEILSFGPVVEAQVWTATFLAEKRAPIAQASGKPKFGKVFNDDGVGKAVLIRPCVSRGKRIRGLPPIYTPTMLEADAGVFGSWPMYFDHLPAAVTEAAAKRGRSVKELGGQVLKPWWERDFVQEGDEEYGYQPGGVLSEVWGSPVLRNIVGNNPNLLHTSIAAWPKSGKPGKAPWGTGVKGMVIEGIRRQPQGSVDYVPRGGAGGRLLLAEGEAADPDLREWPEPSLDPEDARLVVSLAESFYASAAMPEPTTSTPDFTKMSPAELRKFVQESAPHLLPALAESAEAPATAPAPTATTTPGLTESDVLALIERERGTDTPATREDVQSMAEELIEQRETQRGLSAIAHELIESAPGIPASWKADLRARYAVTPEGPRPALLVEAETGDDGKQLSEEDVLRARVEADLKHARDLIAEAQGKPRVTGEGGARKDAPGDNVREAKSETPYWRDRMAELGIVESADHALTIHGVEKVEAA